MPLPDDGSSLDWPPPELNGIRPKMAEWSAWYSGDNEQLEDIYRGQAGALYTTAPARPSQYAGGIVGAVARMFWGTPTADGEQRKKIHVPVASDICTASADLLFSELPELKPPAGTGAVKAMERLEYVLERNKWGQQLNTHAEVSAGLGGAYLRVLVDTSVDDTAPIITVVHADAAVPEFAYGRLQAVTFWHQLYSDANTVIRHLERHERGLVEHGLYFGTKSKLGRRKPLTERRETAGLTVNQDSVIETGYPDGLTAEYIPNILPSRRWRNDPVGAHFGRADYDGVEQTMDAVDETYTSWMRDIRLGKGRVIVPSYMLEQNGPGNASLFNVEREVYTGLNIPPAGDLGATAGMTVQQFAIRTEEHANTVRGLLSAVFRGAGYSSQTFGLVDEAAATATEVTARERRSYATREKKSRYYSDGLASFLEAVTAVDREYFKSGVEPWRPAVEFSPGAQPTAAEMATVVQMLTAAEALSTDTKVRMVHPDWDDDQVQAEVEKIMDERPTVPDMGALPDDGPDEPDPNPPPPVPVQLQVPPEGQEA